MRRLRARESQRDETRRMRALLLQKAFAVEEELNAPPPPRLTDALQFTDAPRAAPPEHRNSLMVPTTSSRMEKLLVSSAKPAAPLVTADFVSANVSLAADVQFAAQPVAAAMASAPVRATSSGRRLNALGVPSASSRLSALSTFVEDVPGATLGRGSRPRSAAESANASPPRLSKAFAADEEPMFPPALQSRISEPVALQSRISESEITAAPASPADVVLAPDAVPATDAADQRLVAPSAPVAAVQQPKVRVSTTSAGNPNRAPRTSSSEAAQWPPPRMSESTRAAAAQLQRTAPPPAVAEARTLSVPRSPLSEQPVVPAAAAPPMAADGSADGAQPVAMAPAPRRSTSLSMPAVATARLSSSSSASTKILSAPAMQPPPPPRIPAAAMPSRPVAAPQRMPNPVALPEAARAQRRSSSSGTRAEPAASRDASTAEARAADDDHASPDAPA